MTQSGKYRYAWVLLIPLFGILWVWLSSLSFNPVPWPDDSAFFFVSKDLFSWPPRWVMIPQAPFEPTYRIWNFNTMPLFPILIGLLRIVGIDGPHALKLLPLFGWFLSASFIVWSLIRGKAPLLLVLSATLVLTFEPILRWSSVITRPESLIGAMGVFILYGYRFGWPNVLRERPYFHPVALFLWIGAMLHFNAIHLVPMVLVLYWREPKTVLKIGVVTLIGLLPWLVTVALKPALFIRQMELQFARLTGFNNPWLNNWNNFTGALLTDMGAPEPWSVGFRAGIITCVYALPLLIGGMIFFLRSKVRLRSREGTTILAAFVWFLAALYLWHTKSEVWFTHFFHLAFWAWTLLLLHEFSNELPKKVRRLAWIPALFPLWIGGLFFVEQYAQASRLAETQTWKWATYQDWIDCIDDRLTQEYKRLGSPKLFRVWGPNFPDILIPLYLKHPEWEFTRTNDFYQRWNLGVKHGHEVEAMVITEIFRPTEEFYSGPLSGKPVKSVWMNWEQYFLIHLERDPKFKPSRFLCQRGRWDAFIYLKNQSVM